MRGRPAYSLDLAADRSAFAHASTRVAGRLSVATCPEGGAEPQVMLDVQSFCTNRSVNSQLSEFRINLALVLPALRPAAQGLAQVLSPLGYRSRKNARHAGRSGTRLAFSAFGLISTIAESTSGRGQKFVGAMRRTTEMSAIDCISTASAP